MMARYSSREMIEIRDVVEAFLTEIRPLSFDAQVARCRELCLRTPGNAQTYNRVHAVGMFFAEIGVCVKSRLIRPNEFTVFDRLVPYYWHRLTPFIIACHQYYGFEVDPNRPLIDQRLVLFEHFRYAYHKLKTMGIALEPNKEDLESNKSFQPFGSVAATEPSTRHDAARTADGAGG